jgi:hypothetical protein
VELDVRIPEGSEEPQPLDVVGVQMRDQQVDARWVPSVERHPERPDPRPGVEDQQAAVFELHGDARRLSAVAHRVGAG